MIKIDFDSKQDKEPGPDDAMGAAVSLCIIILVILSFLIK